MKKIATLLALFLFITATSFAAANKDKYAMMLAKIQKQLTFTAKEKAELGTGMAVVTFTVTQDGTIEIIQLDASTDAQKEAVTKKLNHYYISNAPVKAGATYTMRITFRPE
jgi:hypothetical protein